MVLANPACAVEGFFLGDSIGDDTAQTVGIRGAARTSVHLRRAQVIAQFSRLPKGAIALMSLGLNDAADPYQSLKNDIERVIAAAEKTGEKFVWIGPPCVLKSWDKRSAQLDAYLRERLATTSIQYVSLRDPQICRHGMRSGDGEHFTTAGYRYVWEKIKRDSSFAAEVTAPSAKKVLVATEPEPSANKAERHASGHVYKRASRHRSRARKAGRSSRRAYRSARRRAPRVRQARRRWGGWAYISNY